MAYHRPILSPLKSSSLQEKKGGNQNWIESNRSALLKNLELFFFFLSFLSSISPGYGIWIYMVYNMSKSIQNYYYTSGYSIYSCIHLDVLQSRRRRWKKRKEKKKKLNFDFSSSFIISFFTGLFPIQTN